MKQRAALKRDIEQAIAEAATIKCLTCSTIVITPGYCRHCADYWRDVSNGLFEDDRT